MPFRATDFKVKLVDDEGEIFFLVTFFAGARGDKTLTRHLSVSSWEGFQALVELARLGKMESDAEVLARVEANKPPRITKESVEDYLARGGKITRVGQKASAPSATDFEAWDALLDEICSTERVSIQPSTNKGTEK